jgi:TFA2 Winged helix domain 2
MSTNSYGFDFLKTEHKLNEDGQPLYESATHAIFFESPEFVADARNKPDLEKQFDILAFLQKHRGSGSCLAPNIIYRATGIDLATDVTVANMLQSNPKVKTEFIPDPENPALLVPHYAYQAKYPTVRDRTSLLAQINRMHTGVPARDLLDSYAGIEADIRALVTAGDVIAIQNTEDKDKVLFPRGETFFVELDGLLSLPEPAGSESMSDEESTNMEAAAPRRSPKLEANGGNKKNHKLENDGKVFVVDTDIDPRKQIRRGEAIQVGGQWFRVSSAVRAGVSLSEQPARAQAPLSVVSLADLSQRNEVDGYIRPLTAKKLPLDDALTEAAQANICAARHARERLLKLAHGRSGGVTGQLITQLTASYAHTSNPTTLAASVATTAAPHQHRNKRPNTAVRSATTSTDHQHPAELSKAALEKAAADPALALYKHARRHGCTRDVREMYLATRSAVPESDYELQQVLLEHKMLEPNEQMRRPRLAIKGNNVDNDGKPKKRRYYERKNQRMTNTHLEGTEIGAILARAAEKQKQGKSVGDGGM